MGVYVQVLHTHHNVHSHLPPQSLITDYQITKKIIHWNMFT